jgi:hypothetical protein
MVRVGSLLVLATFVFVPAGCRKERAFHCESMGQNFDSPTPSKDAPRQCFDAKKGVCERLKLSCFAQQRAHCFRYYSDGSYSFRCSPTAPECEKQFHRRKDEIGDYTAENCRLVSPKDLD